ncbi:hypothetical protein H5P52_004463 [Salmonella enterica]|nr:hypothetical protein [Salmonella enterica]
MIHKQIGGKKRQKNVKCSLDYILRVRPEDTAEDRNFVQVMTTTTRADIENFNDYIKPKKFSHPYITGVLSFEESDTDENLKQKMIADFEEVLFSGIAPENRPPVLWVQHRDKGRLELNYTTFNALQDGRAFKAYYHNTDHHLFNAFCEKNNFEHGFSSVLDKDEKNSLIRVPTNIPEEKRAKLEQIQNEILGKIIVQEINNRDELIDYLKSKNIHINRVRKNQISIKFSQEDEKPTVLKGDIYEEGRNYSIYREPPKNNRTRDPEFAKRALAEHREIFDRLLKSRSGRVAERYNRPPKKNASIIESRAKKTNDNEDQNNQYKNADSFDLDSFAKFVFNDFDNNNDSEELNEQDNRNDKIEPRETKSSREERERQVETIDFEQQRINNVVEEVIRRKLRNRETIERVNRQLEFTRRHFSGFVQFFSKIIRPIFVNTRKNEVRSAIEKRRKLAQQVIKNQKQKEVKRFKYK